jgi:hypothetical protein
MENILSNRHLWYSFWKKRAGIDIQDGDDMKSHRFQRSLTFVLILTDIIGTILVKYHAPDLKSGQDPNTKLLSDAYNLAFKLNNVNNEAIKKMESTESEHLRRIGRKRKTKQEFPTQLGSSAFIESLQSAWGLIFPLIKSLQNESLNKIFFKKGTTNRLNRCIQTTFNSILLHSIPKLNKRLQVQYERGVLSN